MVLLAKEESPLARPPRHRSPDEALHEVPSNRLTAGRGCKGVVQFVDRLSAGEGSAASIAKEGTAGASPAGSLGRPLRRGGRADAEGGPWGAAGRDFRGDAAALPRAGSRHPSHPGAPDPGLAGSPW